MTTDGLLEIAVLRRAHGLGGQISVEMVSDRHERLEPGARWLVGGNWLTVTEALRHNDRWLVRFAEVAGRVDAERLTNAAARAEPLDDPEALWVHDAIGATVVEVSGRRRGVVGAVLANPASDLLELDSGALVPTVFVVDHRDGEIVIDPPDGLFDDDGSTDGSTDDGTDDSPGGGPDDRPDADPDA